jgi:hypothetical protein
MLKEFLKNLMIATLFAVPWCLILLVNLVGIDTHHDDHRNARAQVNNLKTAVIAYKIQAKTYPYLLTDLIHNESGINFLDAKEVPLDPWGNAYIYHRTDTSVVIESYGADGRPGGEGDNEDINSDRLSREEYR